MVGDGEARRNSPEWKANVTPSLNNGAPQIVQVQHAVTSAVTYDVPGHRRGRLRGDSAPQIVDWDNVQSSLRPYYNCRSESKRGFSMQILAIQPKMLPHRRLAR